MPCLYHQMAKAVVQAWNRRAVGAVGHGLGHAVIGQNRRIVYADGRAQMSFETNDPQFRHFEGYEDHGVDILCFYEGKRQLKATAITLACTAQMSQGETVVIRRFLARCPRTVAGAVRQGALRIGFLRRPVISAHTWRIARRAKHVWINCEG